MSPKAFELMSKYCEQVLNRPLNTCQPIPRSGDEAVSYLWPLNERFRPRFHQIKTVSYRRQYEKAADAAIYNFVMHDSDWGELPLVVWRVLLERHLQMLVVCSANTLAGNSQFMLMPDELPASARTKFAVACWLYAMKLPYKVTDSSALDIDSPFQHLREPLH